MSVVLVTLALLGYRSGFVDVLMVSLGLEETSASQSATAVPAGPVKAPAATTAQAAATLSQAWGMLARYPTAEYLKVDPSAVGTRVPATDKQLAAFIVVESNGVPPAWFNRVHLAQEADGGVCLQTTNAAGAVYSSRKGAPATTGPC